MSLLEVLIQYFSDKLLQPALPEKKGAIEFVVHDNGYPNVTIEPAPWESHPTTEQLLTFLRSVTILKVTDQTVTDSGLRITAELENHEGKKFVLSLRRVAALVAQYIKAHYNFPA